MNDRGWDGDKAVEAVENLEEELPPFWYKRRFFKAEAEASKLRACNMVLTLSVYALVMLLAFSMITRCEEEHQRHVKPTSQNFLVDLCKHRS